MSDDPLKAACPDAVTLRALLDGTLLDDQLAATQAHVDRCPTCEAALRQMTAGGESWIGMAEKLKSGSDDDPKLAAALERLKADDGSGGESSEPAADPQRTLDFLQPVDDPKLLGKLGQHEISEVVGWGGMGVVLKAYDPSLHRVVAVKVLASHLAHHAVARKRFIREAQAAAAVCHDNVITIHAIDESGPQPKIIMQFVAGGSLQERIDQEGPLELKEILRIAMQTAAGLAAAHAQGVVHRDVKPANILLENGVQRVKLTDFGLARVMDDASLTLSGVIAGTPQYMAPEQAWGRDVDARADLFSLGAVMYAMCSGHSPFRARTTMAVLKRVCEDAPRPLRAINPDVPDWLVALIEKLLAKNPDERFQTATEVSELLSRWLAHVQQPSVVEKPESISAVRGSPDPAASPDRRSPDFSRSSPNMGDLRSSSSAGSGDSRAARVDPVADLPLSDKEKVFMALAIVGACIPLAGLIMFHFVTFPPPSPLLDPGLRYLILSMFWGQFLTLVATSAINLRRKSLEVIPTVIQCVALCLTIYFIPVAVMGFRLLRKRMKSDSSVDENIARRGSPDPAASIDRRSPEFLRHANNEGDLRSNPSAGSGDPRTALDQSDRWKLSFIHSLWPMLVTATLLGVMLVHIVGETGTGNLDSYLGFCLIQMAATFVWCSVFRAAWNTQSWIVWIGAILFLPVAGSMVLWPAVNVEMPLAVKLVCDLHVIMAFAFWFGLLFVRPLLVHRSGNWMSERLTGGQRLLAIACVTIVGAPLVFVVMYWLSYSTKSVPALKNGPMKTTIAVPLDDSPNHRRRSPNEFPKPQLLSGAADAGAGSSGDMSAGGGTAAASTNSETLKPLLGRWVVVSSEGATLGSAAMMGMTGDSGGGAASATPSAGMASGGGMPGMFGGSAPMGSGANASSPPLQWIEFAADHVVVFDGRKAKLFAEFTEDVEPKQITLRDQSNPLSVGAIVWRNGIFRLERDRLIVCWTTGDRLPPTEFVTEDHYAAQLLILRREWNPPPDLLPPGESPPPPPRAVIPFTTDEAKRYQEAWARSADVPIETTNSLGMKLRLIPAGAFDPAGAANFEQIPIPSLVASSTPPIYLSAHEVTVAQFRKFVEATQYATTAERHSTEGDTEPRSWKHPGIVQDGDQHPVVCVSWQDANAFCRWLSDTEQQQYRLPSVAEWAFAARVGLTSSTPLKLPHNARLRFFDTTAPVGGAHANLFGLHDLFGNVGEWANDNLEVQGYEMTFHRAALGGGYRSKRKPDNGIEWLLPRIVGPSEPLDDVGFRVARVIHRDAEVLSGSLPPIEKLFASSAQVTILVNPDRAKVPREKSDKPDGDDKPLDSNKPVDPNAKLEFGKWPRTGPVVALRGLVPVGRFPASPNIVDFEIERASGGGVSQNIGYPKDNALSWMKVDLQKTLDLLDQTDVVPDTVPPLLTDPVYTMPLIFRSDAPWGELATLGWLPLVEPGEPSSKYAVEFRLFRYFDFDVAKDQRWAYRVRLKLASPKDSTDKNGLFTPWAMTEQWVTVP